IRPASHPASRPRTGASLPGTRTSPRTGLTPAGRPELRARLRHDHSPIACHGARTPGRTPGSTDSRGASRPDAVVIRLRPRTEGVTLQIRGRNRLTRPPD